MPITGILLAALVSVASIPQAAPPTPAPTPRQPPAQTPRQPTAQPPKRPAARSGVATLAVRVTDPAGTPVSAVNVTLEGPASRQATTEQGRIAFENLPAGTYRLRFESDGFVTLERELVARGSTPIDVKVTLTPAPEPPPPPPAPVPEPPAPPPPAADVAPLVVDLPAFIEKNFIGREAQKTSALACGSDATATLLQLRDPLTEHTHADWDEFLYVIAGQGTARIQTREQSLTAGVFVMIPRGVAHALSASGRGPLVLLSIRPGDRCPAPAPGR
jgi:mannose-6-phosphate isomerase-like protein (cupin superfamily)